MNSSTAYFNPITSHPLTIQIFSFFRLLPEGLRLLERSEKSIQDPMFRCFDREVSTAAKLLQKIKSELSALKDVCEGKSKFTNTLRELARNISGGTLPPDWVGDYKTVEGISLGEWLSDFCKRVAQLVSIGFGKIPFSHLVRILNTVQFDTLSIILNFNLC